MLTVQSKEVVMPSVTEASRVQQQTNCEGEAVELFRLRGRQMSITVKS